MGWCERPAVAECDTMEGLIGRTPDLRELLIGLGYNPRHEREAASLMQDLIAGIRAEILSFEALQKAVLSALSRSAELPHGPSAFLNSLAMAGNVESATAVLNEDPVHDQVPFVEQIPVLKNGMIRWQSPVHHSLIRKRPADPPRFRSTLAELEKLFGTSHPARAETARLAVIEAVERLRRELDRDTSYLPTSLQYLEMKVTEYRTCSLKPRAQEWLQILMAVLERVVKLRNEIESTGRCDVRAIAEQAVRYLSTPRIHTRGLTSYLLILLLDKRLLTVTRRVSRSKVKAMDLIRGEIAGGSYDAGETVGRLRRLEAEGFYIPSVVYPLLEVSAARPALT
jgi:hypothetical protein